MKKELLEKLKPKKEPYRGWMEGNTGSLGRIVPEIFQAFRDQVRKAKTLREFHLARDSKNNKKSFYRYIRERRKTGENVYPLWKEMRLGY